jgi:hypothetical protein
MSNNHYNNNLQPFANNLRRTMTKAEACLWKYALKSRHTPDPPPTPASGGHSNANHSEIEQF